MDVKCPGCYKITTVFSHVQRVVLCVNPPEAKLGSQKGAHSDESSIRMLPFSGRCCTGFRLWISWNCVSQPLSIGYPSFHNSLNRVPLTFC
uniref:40S ribosomal protein S27 n=1 Tax=Erpetoichthys calabaricus TaxID=27687 RepID=A0A8C4TCV9_ERPCA